MGIISGFMGNASQVDAEKILQKFGDAFVEGETIEAAYKVIRDMFIFTDLRMILIDIQGITGKKTEFHSIPYKSISHFSVESAGHFDLDSELKIYVRGMDEPVSKQFKKGADIWGVQNSIVKHI